tara:strand:- start:777 stop:980 length:204 start_codon:yes stop_codon:yes gene_type:complete
MNNKTIICTRCKKPTKVKLTDPIKLKADFTVCCKNCSTELAYVDGDDFFPKYNLWAIRTQTAKILRQ